MEKVDNFIIIFKLHISIPFGSYFLHFIKKELITKKYDPLSLRLKGSCLFP